jgi:hypothetical protein
MPFFSSILIRFHYAYICRKRTSRSTGHDHDGHHLVTTHMESLEKQLTISCKDENDAPTLFA